MLFECRFAMPSTIHWGQTLLQRQQEWIGQNASGCVQSWWECWQVCQLLGEEIESELEKTVRCCSKTKIHSIIEKIDREWFVSWPTNRNSWINSVKNLQRKILPSLEVFKFINLPLSRNVRYFNIGYQFTFENRYANMCMKTRDPIESSIVCGYLKQELHCKIPSIVFKNGNKIHTIVPIVRMKPVLIVFETMKLTHSFCWIALVMTTTWFSNQKSCSRIGMTSIWFVEVTDSIPESCF